MTFLHRKTLSESHEVFIFIFVSGNPCDLMDCPKPPPRQPPPPPPPPSLTTNHPLSAFLIVMFCCLAVTLSFICYLICVKRYRTRRETNHGNTNRETREDLVNEDLGPVVHNPIWLINTVGLDQSQIEAIQAFKYKKDDKLIEGTDCSVCLSEFEEDERLRLLPKCSHAFHVSCIDMWLRSHKNCPLCRAPVVGSTTDGHETEHPTTESNPIAPRTSEQTEPPVNGSESIDNPQHVVDVENSGEIVSVQGDQATNNHPVVLKKPSSMRKNELKLNESSSSSDLQKPMKISSSRHLLRKASSYRSNSGPYNQSI